MGSPVPPPAANGSLENSMLITIAKQPEYESTQTQPDMNFDKVKLQQPKKTVRAFHVTSGCMITRCLCQ